MAEKNEKGISLPELPKGKEFEEYILAYFQSSGFYTEKNVEKKDLLELDIVVTDYSTSSPDIRLVEVKSGKWGMSDIFKINGWMNYLCLNEGMFIAMAQSASSVHSFQKKIADDLGIELIFADIKDDKCPFSSSFTKNNAVDDFDSSCWRFSYWLERNIIEKLIHKDKSTTGVKRFSVLRDYNQNINDDIFYSRNKAARVFSLYKTFQKYPRISARCGNEMGGIDFDAKTETISHNLYKETFYDCKYNDIQISTMIEHKARVAILKSAVDYESTRTNNAEKSKTSLTESLLPQTFHTGIAELKTHKYFHRYPVFWQWFLWLFGGFILKDYEQQEYELLSEKTSIPVEEIPNALKAYDILFPTNGGWFMDLNPNSNILVLKMFPVLFRGIGVHYRKKIYTKNNEFDDLKVTGIYTLSDISKWNNSAVEVLSC